jgi:hypothetical protein
MIKSKQTKKQKTNYPSTYCNSSHVHDSHSHSHVLALATVIQYMSSR